MAAGLKTLELVSKPGFYETLSAKTETLTSGLKERAKKAGIAFTTNQVGGMFGLFFSKEEKINSFAQVMACDQALFKHFFHAMLEKAFILRLRLLKPVLFPAAHSDEDLEQTLAIAEKVFAQLS